MLKNRLVIFILKRIAVCTLCLAVAALFFDNRWVLLTGLLIGAVLSGGRFVSNAWIFKTVTESAAATKFTFLKVLVFVINQILLLLLLFVFFKLNIWLFIGLISGVLTAPLVIILNSFTEFFGITKNNFYLD